MTDLDPQKTLVRLEALRDEVRLKLHLAGMELKDEWARIEPEVRDAAHSVQHAPSASLERLRDVIDRLERFVEKLS